MVFWMGSTELSNITRHSAGYDIRPLQNTEIVIASAAKQSDAKHRPE
jgi:hypothetical protein